MSTDAVPHYITNQGRRPESQDGPAEFVYTCSCEQEFAATDFTYAWSDFIDHATGMPPRDRSLEAEKMVVGVVLEPLSRLSIPIPRLDPSTII